jgi:hypothetical protein
MEEEVKTYQPGWDDAKRKKHHHHHHAGSSSKLNKGLGGALRMIDKQAYYGLVFILVMAALWGLIKLGKTIAAEFKAMPNDDPTTEMAVDELRIHKVEEQDALLMGDSLAQTYNLDSIRRRVQIETRPVYRPPRQEDEWYITQREWKAIWLDFKIWRKNRREAKEAAKQAKQQNNDN